MSDEPEAPRRPRADIVGLTLAVAFIAGLIGLSIWIILPFAGALIWAALLVVSTWNGMLWIQARLWNRRWLAVTVVTLVMLLAVFVPLSLALVSIVKNADEFAAWASTLQSFHLPALPAWVASLPLIGEKIAELWQQAAASGLTDLTKVAKPYANAVFGWLAGRIGGAGAILMQHHRLQITEAAVRVRVVRRSLRREPKGFESVDGDVDARGTKRRDPVQVVQRQRRQSRVWRMILERSVLEPPPHE